MAESLEDGLFTARSDLRAFSAENVLVLKRQPVRSGLQRITLRARGQASLCGRDPYNFRIDRNSEYNVTEVTAAGT